MRPAHRPRSLPARAALFFLALLTHCSARGCGASSTAPDAAALSTAPPGPSRERCRTEVAHAAVAAPPGLGPISALMPACGGDSLAVWALRGHTLSRFERPRAPGSTFSVPEVIATGADRLGPVSPEAFDGPVAWRSPTLGMDPMEGDEWWVGWIDRSAIPGSRARIGSTLLAPGAVGIGVIAPIGARTERGVEVLTTVARQGRNPQLVRHLVPAPSNTVESLGEDPPGITDGELKAWDPAGRVALAFAVVGENDASVLRALDFSGGAMAERGTVPVAREHVLVHPRGVRAAGATWFAYADFDVAPRDESSGARERCLSLDPSLCVRPGPLMLARVDARGVSTVQVAEEGLPDTFADDGAGGLLVMFVGATGAGAQRAARVDAATRDVRQMRLIPSDDVPPLDHPTLVACGGEPWLVAEVLVSEGAGDERDAAAGAGPGDAGAGARGPRETAVMALPFGCIAR